MKRDGAKRERYSHRRKGGMNMAHRKKLNCWEFKHCGRVYGGIMDGNFGICPASLEKRLDGVHDGKNAGRACWVVAGTMCNDRIQGTFGFKHKNCLYCDFYKFVHESEGNNLIAPEVLLRKLQEC